MSTGIIPAYGSTYICIQNIKSSSTRVQSCIWSYIDPKEQILIHVWFLEWGYSGHNFSYFHTSFSLCALCVCLLDPSWPQYSLWYFNEVQNLDTQASCVWGKRYTRILNSWLSGIILCGAQRVIHSDINTSQVISPPPPKICSNIWWSIQSQGLKFTGNNPVVISHF